MTVRELIKELERMRDVERKGECEVRMAPYYDQDMVDEVHWEPPRLGLDGQNGVVLLEPRRLRVLEDS